MRISDVKMVADEHTAYDEVITDINSLGHFMEKAGEDKRFKARKLLTEKCKQLMRLLNDDDSQLE